VRAAKSAPNLILGACGSKSTQSVFEDARGKEGLGLMVSARLLKHIFHLIESLTFTFKLISKKARIKGWCCWRRIKKDITEQKKKKKKRKLDILG
jgi:hypothetical protein